MSGYDTAHAVQAQAAGTAWWMPLLGLLCFGLAVALLFGMASGLVRHVWARRTPPAARTALPQQDADPYDWQLDPDYGVDWARYEREVGLR